MDPLHGLKNDAIKKAQESGKLEDIERVASVYQLMAEAQKRSAEAATERKLARQEGLKNWAALLVPLLSVLTLAVVVSSLIQQQRESRRSREDEQWRAAISELGSASTSPNTPIPALFPQVRLKPFLKSPAYGEQANQLARLLLPRLADADAFKDLFAAVEWHDLDQMIAVDRGLNRLYDALGRERKRLAALTSRGAASGTAPDPAAAAASGSSGQDPRLAQLAADQGSISKQISYLCNQVGDTARSGKFRATGLDMEDGWFHYCDLSKVDWSGAMLSDALFQHVDLEDARFARVTEIDNFDLADTAWWKAAELSPPLLQTLMANFDPGTVAQRDLADKPSKPAYVARAIQLCKAVNLNCPPASIKYTVAAGPKPGAAPASAAQ